MARKRHSAEQIINKLREAEVLLAQGHSVPEVSRRLGVTVQTYYRWRQEYVGLKTDQAKKLKSPSEKTPGSSESSGSGSRKDSKCRRNSPNAAVSGLTMAAAYVCAPSNRSCVEL